MGMTEQHELSAIQEVETTVNSSQIAGLFSLTLIHSQTIHQSVEMKISLVISRT